MPPSKRWPTLLPPSFLLLSIRHYRAQTQLFDRNASNQRRTVAPLYCLIVGVSCSRRGNKNRVRVIAATPNLRYCIVIRSKPIAPDAGASVTAAVTTVPAGVPAPNCATLKFCTGEPIRLVTDHSDCPTCPGQNVSFDARSPLFFSAGPTSPTSPTNLKTFIETMFLHDGDAMINNVR